MGGGPAKLDACGQGGGQESIFVCRRPKWMILELIPTGLCLVGVDTNVLLDKLQ